MVQKTEIPIDHSFQMVELLTEIRDALKPQEGKRVHPFSNINLSAAPVLVPSPRYPILRGYFLYNLGDAMAFFKFYDTQHPLAAGSTLPLLTIPLAASTGANVWMGGQDEDGIQFNEGIAIAATTGIAPSNTTSPTANTCVCNLWIVQQTKPR